MPRVWLPTMTFPGWNLSPYHPERLLFKEPLLFPPHTYMRFFFLFWQGYQNPKKDGFKFWVENWLLRAKGVQMVHLNLGDKKQPKPQTQSSGKWMWERCVQTLGCRLGQLHRTTGLNSPAIEWYEVSQPIEGDLSVLLLSFSLRWVVLRPLQKCLCALYSGASWCHPQSHLLTLPLGMS